jgi:hypothetical protein
MINKKFSIASLINENSNYVLSLRNLQFYLEEYFCSKPYIPELFEKELENILDSLCRILYHEGKINELFFDEFKQFLKSIISKKI